MNIWAICQGEKHIRALSETPWRVVEAQHVLSTRDLVDSVEEHDMLEDLLEASKPDIEPSKNYLLYTPFRYPPLKDGSRFGAVFEPSLWYGALMLETALAEVAYYQMKFRTDTTAILGYIETSLTAFQTVVKTNAGVDLTCAPFQLYQDKISSTTSYQDSQALGSAMREAKVEAFLYISARAPTPAKNIALFPPDVFHKKSGQYVYNQQTWMCLSSANNVEFTRISISEKSRYCFSG